MCGLIQSPNRYILDKVKMETMQWTWRKWLSALLYDFKRQFKSAPNSLGHRWSIENWKFRQGNIDTTSCILQIQIPVTMCQSYAVTNLLSTTKPSRPHRCHIFVAGETSWPTTFRHTHTHFVELKCWNIVEDSAAGTKGSHRRSKQVITVPVVTIN